MCEVFAGNVATLRPLGSGTSFRDGHMHTVGLHVPAQCFVCCTSVCFVKDSEAYGAEVVLGWILADAERMRVLLTWLDLDWYPMTGEDCNRWVVDILNA